MNIHKIDKGHIKYLLDMVQSHLPGIDITIILNEDLETKTAIRMASTNKGIKLGMILKEASQKIESKDAVKENPPSNNCFDLEVRVKVKFESMPDEKHSILNDIKVLCPFPEYLKPALKFDNGHLTQNGVQAAAAVLIHGVASNIHYGHQMKVWDSAEHLRYCIGMLEDRFATVAEIQTSNDINKF